MFEAVAAFFGGGVIGAILTVALIVLAVLGFVFVIIMEIATIRTHKEDVEAEKAFDATAIALREAHVREFPEYFPHAA
jgi:uncharacterized membrane protein